MIVYFYNNIWICYISTTLGPLKFLMNIIVSDMSSKVRLSTLGYLIRTEIKNYFSKSRLFFYCFCCFSLKTKNSQMFSLIFIVIDNYLYHPQPPPSKPWAYLLSPLVSIWSRWSVSRWILGSLLLLHKKSEICKKRPGREESWGWGSRWLAVSTI